MKGHSRASFRKRLTVVLIVSTLCMTLYAGLASYRLATGEFRKMSAQMTENMTGEVASSVSDYLDTVDGYTTRMLGSAALRTLAAQAEVTPGVFSTYAPSISLTVRGSIVEAVRESVHFRRVDLYLINGYKYSSLGAPLCGGYADCCAALSENGFEAGDGYIGTQWGLFPQPDGTAAFTCVRFIYDALAQKVGAAVFQFSNADIVPLYSDISAAYIASSEGVILSAPDSARVGGALQDEALLNGLQGAFRSGSIVARAADGSEALMSYSPIGGRNMWLIVPVEAYNASLRLEMADYTRSVLWMLLAGVVFSLLIAKLLSDSLSKSIVSLTSFIRQVDGTKNSSLRYRADSASEIAQIGGKINEMLDSLDAASQARETELKARQTLELSLLRAQINPHLLYNTLNSALWALQNDNTGDASALITAMSEYFKLSLSAGRQVIPLRDELALIRYYLQLQHLARHRDVRLELDVPEEFLPHPILKLTLQPIVENAVLHGLDGYRSDGVISISARRAGRFLRLTVQDNGIGILPEELDRLTGILREYPSENVPHAFGLYSIHRSLIQAYGPDCGLAIESGVSEFTRVTVTMPYTPTPEPEETNQCLT